MNIFIMILVTIFMLGYYMISAPSQRTIETETEYAIARADMRSIAECATAMQNAQIRGVEFNDVCIEQNGIHSQFVCLDKSRRTTKCEIVNKRKPAFSYIVTASATLPDTDYNSMMEILEEYYADSGMFGIFMDGKVMAGGTSNLRSVPDALIKEMKLENGQLVYVTQYEIPDNQKIYTISSQADVTCPAGTTKTYRFGRWQCVGINTKSDCAGDTIWDSDLLECVPDESRRPLCASQQTAVMVDSVWECIDPFAEKVCPDNMLARLNYNTLEWECVEDPNTTQNVKKCKNVLTAVVPGRWGATLHIQASSCTDCEQMITNSDTCESKCVPDPAQINNPKCYAGGASSCDGPNRAFYFGFPDSHYVSQVPNLPTHDIPIGGVHNQNRMFNCMVCDDGVIDTARSVPPYTAICK